MKDLKEYIEHVTIVSDDYLSLSGIAVTNMRSNPSWYIYLQDSESRVYRGDGTSFESAVFVAAMQWKKESDNA